MSTDLRLLEVNGCIGVGCKTCNSMPGDPCSKGGESWPEMANRPHQRRREDALLVRWWDEFGRRIDAPLPAAGASAEGAGQ